MKAQHTLLWICVNYNTYSETQRLILNISEAHKKVRDELNIELIVADNSIPNHSIDHDYNSAILFRQIKTEKNTGYFGAVNYVFQNENIRPDLYDYVIVSNVDIQIHEDFFKNLIFCKVPERTGIIAPSIISYAENIDKNPGMISRPSKFKMFLYQLLYSNSYLYRVFLIIRKHRIKQLKTDHQDDHKIIYAAHGSIIILCRNYFSLQGTFDYPVFLFGEEIFLAEELLKRNLLTFYTSAIKVFDDEHINTSAFKIQTQCKLSYTAIHYLRKKYFK